MFDLWYSCDGMANIGRPTKYREEYVEKAYKLSLLGAIDEEIADFLEIEVSTLNKWKLDYPEFSESLKKGKREADAIVADKLFKRATGYEHPEVDIKMFQGEIIKTDLIRHYPPDTTAAIFWLKNRQPKKWRDKQEIEQSGEVKHTYEELDDEQLDAALKARENRISGTA